MLHIIHEPILAERTTLRLGGKAIAEVSFSHVDDIPDLDATIKKLGGSVFVLGAGSNILASDADIPLVLVKPKCNQAPTIVKNDSEKIFVSVGNGVRLPRLLGMCAKNGFSGLEGLCGIPGSVGGAVAMNAGSFGDETCAALHSVQIYSPQVGVVCLGTEDFSYDYRKFVIHKLNTWFLILEATFILTHEDSNGIKKRMFHNFFKKKSTQPVRAWSAGCVFKNPSVENPAGKLLDVCGFKGKRKGGMQFSPQHANFLVNEGSGTATAAFDLLAEAQEAVFERFAIKLEPEVKILCQEG